MKIRSKCRGAINLRGDDDRTTELGGAAWKVP